MQQNQQPTTPSTRDDPAEAKAPKKRGANLTDEMRSRGGQKSAALARRNSKGKFTKPNQKDDKEPDATTTTQ